MFAQSAWSPGRAGCRHGADRSRRRWPTLSVELTEGQMRPRLNTLHQELPNHLSNQWHEELLQPNADRHADEPGPRWHIAAEAAEQQYWKNTTDTAERSVYVCASFRRHAGRRLLGRQGGGAAQVHSKEGEAEGRCRNLAKTSSWRERVRFVSPHPNRRHQK